jgi:hypothetical protein
MEALMKNIIVLVVGIVSIHAHADDWICKTQSVIKQSQATIITCGIGEETSESVARDLAREDAVQEFRRFCQESSDCREFDYNVEPKRLDCERHGQLISCYQALQFNILDVKRKDIYLDLPNVEKQLAQKKHEIFVQELRIDRLKELKAQSELTEKNRKILGDLESKVQKSQAEQIKLESEAMPESGYIYTHQLFKNSIKISTSYWNASFFKKGELNSFLNLGYEYRPTKRLGLGITYGFGTDLTSAGTTQQNTGTPNTQSAQPGSTQIHDLSVYDTLYLSGGLYLKGELGYAHAIQNVYSVSYGPLGTATQSSASQNETSKMYMGTSLGYDSRNHEKGMGFFVEVGARQSFSDGKLGAVGVAGFNFGF